ncbi:AAA family ATPase [Synechococcus sp. Cruz-9H2]|uniref:ATP-dependent nuclease n=1 Tax=unclassified Synechococcus TaxID=2626047 RepID=UPI0020CD6063|nr:MULTISPECIES: AAA family ATPase [unclassified Synechococcus]MCP9818605.1 AAA family ATPase [Synechococcus sp. Cruz-9H2]MCP9842835.1 AAA family ATPase [Synechococcus sp. Edmonson 11F2]MCP9855501.1 AAA family ATPase [Synechococcus sp. Cruz-9C9]MCP9862253.1 AAA family ATPase [Synechococcus sp. Cruz-7E5]MCP9869524.1 AAA family ATPase [Synechococcus sp. Cruz-7B9]
MAILLDSVEISNFRSVSSCALPLSTYTPIIGYNNSGKSNSITAIQWLLRRSLLAKADFHSAALPIEVVGTITGVTAAHVAEMPPPQQRQITPYIAGETLKVKRTQPPTASKAGEITLSVWDPTTLSWNANPTGIDNALGALLPEPIRIGAMENAAEDAAKSKTTTTIGKLLAEFIAPVRAAHAVELSGFLQEISRRVSADGDMRFAELVTIENQITVKVNDLFPGIGAKLHFPVPELEDLVKGGTLRLQEGTNSPRDFGSYGHGTQRSVQMALVRHLAEVRRGAGPGLGTTLLLIDEPELYLHPFAVEQIRAALKSLGRTGYQVIFSTHSAQLVPASDAQFALLMRKDAARGTYARSRLRDAIQRAVPNSVHQMEQLFTLGNSSQVLFADRVLLTEGKTELRLLPAIYEAIAGRSLGQERCALVAQSGVNDTRKSTEILAAMDVPCKAIVDLDYAFSGAVRDGYLVATDPDISALKLELASLAAAGRVSVGPNGLPQGGVVTSAQAFVLLAQHIGAQPHIVSLHSKLLAQNIWLWQLGDIEAHLGLAEKSEREWARFNVDLNTRGLHAACPHPASIQQMLAWAIM